MRLISRDDLLALREIGAVTRVGALPEPHHQAEHLPGPVNLPRVLTADLPARWTPDCRVIEVAHCSGRSGGWSNVVAAAFICLGFTDARIYDGGKADWVEVDLPFEADRAGAIVGRR